MQEEYVIVKAANNNALNMAVPISFSKLAGAQNPNVRPTP